MTDIILPESSDLAKFSDADFGAVAAAGDWLPRLGILSGASDLFKSGKATEIGKMLVQWNSDRFRVLTPEINIISYTWRPKALDMRGATPLAYFDRTKDTFKAVQDLSNVKDSNCMAGPEFLVWIPDVGELGMLFCGSKSARRVAPNLLALMTYQDPQTGLNKIRPTKATLKVKYVAPQNSKYSWHAFDVLPCSAPIATQPEADDLEEQIRKFLNPQDSQIEAAPATPAGTESRER